VWYNDEISLVTSQLAPAFLNSFQAVAGGVYTIQHIHLACFYSVTERVNENETHVSFN
jgi:hypothetical protein